MEHNSLYARKARSRNHSSRMKFLLNSTAQIGFWLRKQSNLWRETREASGNYAATQVSLFQWSTAYWDHLKYLIVIMVYWKWRGKCWNHWRNATNACCCFKWKVFSSSPSAALAKQILLVVHEALEEEEWTVLRVVLLIKGNHLRCGSFVMNWWMIIQRVKVPQNLHNQWLMPTWDS